MQGRNAGKECKEGKLRRDSSYAHKHLRRWKADRAEAQDRAETIARRCNPQGAQLDAKRERRQNADEMQERFGMIIFAATDNWQLKTGNFLL